MTRGAQYLLLIILLGYPFSDSYADSTDIQYVTAVSLAQKMCAIQSRIYILDQLITVEKANGASWDGISQLKDFRDPLFADYDSLKVPFQLAVHHNPGDFNKDAEENVWFVYIQAFLHQRGINLSANNRFDYVKLLPEEGSAIVDLKLGSRDTFLTTYFIDSSSFIILNQHYPNWLKSPFERIQKLDLGIDAFLRISRERFVPFTAQTELMNCGPTSLKMVLEQFGAYHSLDELAGLTSLDETGTSFGDLTRAALQLKMTTENAKISYEKLMLEMDRPVIVHWENRHFIVVYAMTDKTVWVADPDLGRIKYNRQEFCESWLYGSEKKDKKGSVLTFKLTAAFYE